MIFLIRLILEKNDLFELLRSVIEKEDLNLRLWLSLDNKTLRKGFCRASIKLVTVIDIYTFCFFFL